MDLYAEEVKQLEQKVREQPRDSVVFYGSSTIRMWTTLNEAFPHIQLQNLGFGGSTLAACAWYIERLVMPAHPRAVILYAGDNDLGENRQPQEVYLFFCSLAEKIQRYLPGVPLSFISIKPSPARWGIVEEIRKTNALIEPNTEFIDLSAAMLDADGKPRHELYQADGLHLSPAGYAVWQEQLNQKCMALKMQEMV